MIKGYLKKFLQVNSTIVNILYDQNITTLLAIALSLTLPNNKINTPIFYIN